MINTNTSYSETPIISFDVTTYQTLSRELELETDKYNWDGENYDLSEINWDTEMLNQRHYTPLDLIRMFRKYLEEDRSHNHKHIIDECLAWEECETWYETS